MCCAVGCCCLCCACACARAPTVFSTVLYCTNYHCTYSTVQVLCSCARSVTAGFVSNESNNATADRSTTQQKKALQELSRTLLSIKPLTCRSNFSQQIKSGKHQLQIVQRVLYYTVHESYCRFRPHQSCSWNIGLHCTALCCTVPCCTSPSCLCCTSKVQYMEIWELNMSKDQKDCCWWL